MRVLSQKALDMLDDVPPWISGDGQMQAVVQAEAAEFQRIEDAADAIRNAAFPAQAQDVTLAVGGHVASLLSMWETLLNLPVNPPGATLADRQAKVRAHIQKRNSAAGSDWVAVLTQALGTSAWTYQEGPVAYTVTITLPTRAGSYTAAQVAALARIITPAHLDIIVGFTGGFLIGISLVGTEPL